MEKQWRKRGSLLPHPGFELRLQGQIQGHVQLQEGTRWIRKMACWKHRFWICKTSLNIDFKHLLILVRAAGATSMLFVYSLDFARTRLASDAKAKGGQRQFTGIIDVYRKTLASDGILGLYRGFGPSVAGIAVYRGIYFGFYDSLKPYVLVGMFKDNFLASFMLGWGVTTVAGLSAYPLDTVRRRMMMTSGEGSETLLCNVETLLINP
jgi:hypothetical protein